MKIYFSALLLAMSACQAPETESQAEEIGNTLEGEWRNLSMRIDINKKGGAATSVYEVDSSTWEQKLKIKAINTSFNADRTFESPHYNLRDSLVLDQKGRWMANDSVLTMITESPFADTAVCKFTVSGGVAKFECWVDWDQDGEKDDLYVGTQRRQN